MLFLHDALPVLIIVAIIHVLIGYVLITGLAYKAAKHVIERVTTVDVEEPPPPEEDVPPPPEPKETAPPPPVAPPPPISIAPSPPPIRTQRSEEHTSELQSLMRISYAVFC